VVGSAQPRAWVVVPYASSGLGGMAFESVMIKIC
jgi:hypothetical protein